MLTLQGFFDLLESFLCCCPSTIAAVLIKEVVAFLPGVSFRFRYFPKTQIFMKKSILLVCLLLCGTIVFAQGSLEVKGYFGGSGTLVGPNADVVGGSSVELEGFKEFGLIFSKGIGGKFRLNGGLAFAYSQVNFTPNIPPCFNCLSVSYSYNPDFRMISVPAFAEYQLTKFLFVAAGPLIDFQLSKGNRFDQQSGIGYLLGLGGKVRSEKFTFSLFPNYKRHAVIPFEKPIGYKDFLQEFGLQLGVGYSF